MNAIAAVDKNWAIGLKNKLLVSIPTDMRYFQRTTMKKVVIMGRKTLESFPEGKPLKDRTNVVLTRSMEVHPEGAIICNTVDEVLAEAEKYPPQDVFVIGGASVYKELLPYCDKAYITKIDRAFDADAYFPNLDQEEDWELTQTGEEQTYFDMEYWFTIYERIKSSES